MSLGFGYNIDHSRSGPIKIHKPSTKAQNAEF